MKIGQRIRALPLVKIGQRIGALPPPPRENRLTNWSVTEFNEKNRPRIIKPAAIPIGRPVSELERYGIKGN